jgi:hypothetical protein
MDWPTKQEAADALGVSTKTLEKYVAAGKLRQAMQNRINLPPRAVIDPSTLERMVSERSSLVTVARSENVPSSPSKNNLEAFAEMLSEVPRTEWPVPLWLTEEQAVRYSGLGIGHLRGTVAWRKIGPRGSLVCKRADLDAL